MSLFEKAISVLMLLAMVVFWRGITDSPLVVLAAGVVVVVHLVAMFVGE